LRGLLRAYLDFHRETLALKCAGLADDELRRRSASPSTLSLLGLVRHRAEVTGPASRAARTDVHRSVMADPVPRTRPGA
jgi:hypothetical protein